MKPIPMHAIPRNSAQFHAIPRIFNCFLFRNYSAIARNEMTQAEAIARNRIPIGNPNKDQLLNCLLKTICFLNLG